MHLVEIFLPVADNEGCRFEAGHYEAVTQFLSEWFGDLTAFTRAPAEGLSVAGGARRPTTS